MKLLRAKKARENTDRVIRKNFWSIYGSISDEVDGVIKMINDAIEDRKYQITIEGDINREFLEYLVVSGYSYERDVLSSSTRDLVISIRIKW